MKFDYCLFDLDGTLTDPKIGITSSVAYTLDKYGISVEDKDSLKVFIGPPLHESFCKYFKFSNMMAYDAINKYREYYRETGIYENVLYDGVPEMLAKLKAAGVTVIMATSKPEIFAKQIAGQFDIEKYFDNITGSELDGTRVDKAEVIRCALERCGITDFSRAVMVGDRKHDIVGAKKTGLRSAAVMYGYGSLEEFQEFGADIIIDTVADLEKYLLS